MKVSFTNSFSKKSFVCLFKKKSKFLNVDNKLKKIIDIKKINTNSDFVVLNDYSFLIFEEEKDYRKSAKKIVDFIKKYKINSVIIPIFDALNISNFVEGLFLSNYVFDKYLSEKKQHVFDVKLYSCENLETISKKILESEIISKYINSARDLVNEPSNIMNPELLSEFAKDIGKKNKFDVEVYDVDDIKKLKMGCFLSVAKGSVHKPKLIVMRYLNGGNSPKIGLIGKGLTFDTGGYSLKPSQYMLNMKGDMAGAAAVINATGLIAEMNLPVNLITVVAACENTISECSYKPDDILTSMNGKTVEIKNTDAEGRLTLIDAITYIQRKENVKQFVDIATLTGAVSIALGDLYSGVLSNNDKFYKKLEIASQISDDKIWRLPIENEYKIGLKSDVADLSNCSYDFREASTITAGMFIGEFVENDNKWIHIDIAGTSNISSPKSCFNKGPTGYGVKLLFSFVKQLIS